MYSDIDVDETYPVDFRVKTPKPASMRSYNDISRSFDKVTGEPLKVHYRMQPLPREEGEATMHFIAPWVTTSKTTPWNDWWKFIP